MDNELYLQHLRKLQTELCIFQAWVEKEKKRVVIVFEGRDAAGKGGVIRAMTERIKPRAFRVEALPIPTAEQKKEPSVKRFESLLPEEGQVVIFDRSWYNRAGVDYVMNFDGLPLEELHQRREEFFEYCTPFEKGLGERGIILVKFWLEVSWEQQRKRLQARIQDPLRQWKLSKVDARSLWYWNEYTKARDMMLARSKEIPWVCVNSNDKKKARLNCLAHLLSLFDYKYTDKVSDLLKTLSPDQLPSLLAASGNLNEIECLTDDFFISAKSTNSNWRLNKEARVLQMLAFEALLKGEQEKAIDFIKKSVESDRGTSLAKANETPLFDPDTELTTEQKAALGTLERIQREVFNPDNAWIIAGVDTALLRRMEKTGLLTCRSGNSYQPTDEMGRLAKENPDEFSRKLEEARHLGDLWKRAKLRKHLSTSQNQGIPPTMGWPLLTGVHLAYKAGVTGRGVTVALMDTPFWWDHPDLVRTEKISMRKDDDDTPYPVEKVDVEVGTAVAGIIASDQIGIAPNVTLCMVKAGETVEDAASSIKALLAFVEKRSEKLIVFFPYLPAEYNERLARVLAELSNSNVLVVTAETRGDEGNANLDVYRKETLCVSTIDWKLEPTEEYCKTAKLVGYGAYVFAPTHPTGYVYLRNAPAARAYACGIAALTWSANPDKSSREIKDMLEKGALKIKKKTLGLKLLRFIPPTSVE